MEHLVVLDTEKVIDSSMGRLYTGPDMESIRKLAVREGYQIEVVYDTEWVRITIADDDQVEADNEDTAWRLAIGAFIRNRFDSGVVYFTSGTARERLADLITYHFPDGILMVFYPDGIDEGDPESGLCAVEDNQGNMWRVWADGDTQRYAVR